MTKKTKIVKTVYLYVVSMVSLLFVAIGSYTLFSTALKTYVLTQAEKGGYSRCNEQPPVNNFDFKSSSLTTEEQKVQIEQMLKDYETWKANNTGEQCYTAERQSSIVDALATLFISLPLFIFHWKLARKEKEENQA